MKKKVILFLRTVYLTSVIIFCLVLGLYGICKAYEGIRYVGFGEYRKAIEIDGEEINIFDFKY